MAPRRRTSRPEQRRGKADGESNGRGDDRRWRVRTDPAAGGLLVLEPRAHAGLRDGFRD
jgi:hypothetical protein